MSSIIDDWTNLQRKIEKQAHNDAIDEFVSRFKDMYYNMIGIEFDNAILKMEEFAEKMKYK